VWNLQGHRNYKRCFWRKNDPLKELWRALRPLELDVGSSIWKRVKIFINEQVQIWKCSLHPLTSDHRRPTISLRRQISGSRLKTKNNPYWECLEILHHLAGPGIWKPSYFNWIIRNRDWTLMLIVMARGSKRDLNPTPPRTWTEPD